MHFKTLFFTVLTLSLNLCSMDPNPNMKKKDMILPLTTITLVNPDTNDEHKTVEDIFGDVDKWMFVQSDSDTEEIINIPTPAKKRCYLSKKNCLLFIKNVIKYGLFSFGISYPVSKMDILKPQWVNANNMCKQLNDSIACKRANWLYNEQYFMGNILFLCILGIGALEPIDLVSTPHCCCFSDNVKSYCKNVLLALLLGAGIGTLSGILGSYI